MILGHMTSYFYGYFNGHFYSILMGLFQKWGALRAFLGAAPGRDPGQRKLAEWTAGPAGTGPASNGPDGT